MAHEYAELARERQGSGPYRLLGWSMGGVIAHAVAAELESTGDEVAFLGLLDAGHAKPDAPFAEWDLPAPQPGRPAPATDVGSTGSVPTRRAF